MLRLPWRRRSYMLMSEHGNAITAWTNEKDARAGLEQILEAEPEAADKVVLMVFDHKGMAIYTLYPFDES